MHQHVHTHKIVRAFVRSFDCVSMRLCVRARAAGVCSLH